MRILKPHGHLFFNTRDVVYVFLRTKLLSSALTRKMATSGQVGGSDEESQVMGNSSDSEKVTIAPSDPSAAVKMDFTNPSEVTDIPAKSPQVVNARKKKKKKNKSSELHLHPNYFVCQRITNSTLLTGLNRVIEHVCSEEKLYARFAYTSARLHLTWCTFRATDQIEAERALACLQAARTDLCQLAPREPLRVEGVGQFSGHLLYAFVIPDPTLAAFSEKMQALLQAEGIATPGNHNPFIPHLTLIKRNPKAKRTLKSNSIDADLLAGFQETYFGEQVVDVLDVCVMRSTRKKDEFYELVGSILLKSDS
uniref:A-kinase anchor protein 7 isoform gamma n=1 Tax=Schistocephalus solidus TaxID=70667 RepID=A0A0V0J347_SCHSO